MKLKYLNLGYMYFTLIYNILHINLKSYFFDLASFYIIHSSAMSYLIKFEFWQFYQIVHFVKEINQKFHRSSALCQCCDCRTVDLKPYKLHHERFSVFHRNSVKCYFHLWLLIVTRERITSVKIQLFMTTRTKGDRDL